jgi:outer membrane biosynthesis protein TonB
VWTDRLQNEPTLPVGIPEPFAGITSHCVRRDPKSRWTVSHVLSKFQPTPVPAPARPKLEKQRIKLETQRLREKSEIIAKAGAEIIVKARKEISSHIYAVGFLAVIAVAILAASTLHRHPAATNISLSNQPGGTALEKPSPNPRHNSTDRASRQAQSFASTGQIIRQVLPNVTSSALRTIHGKVRVTVRVHTDGAGNVAKAEFVSTGPSRYFANHAFEAAQDWKFASSDANPHVWVLQFVFQRSGTSVNPRPMNS